MYPNKLAKTGSQLKLGFGIASLLYFQPPVFPCYSTGEGAPIDIPPAFDMLKISYTI